MTSRNDRAEGVLLATAAGDALGAPYESVAEVTMRTSLSNAADSMEWVRVYK